MKNYLTVLFLFLLTNIYAQRIGELAPERPPDEFPLNAWGVDVLIGESGFGLGTFYRHSFSTKSTGFIDFSISESKDEREFEFVDYFGRTFVAGKKNRVFFLPLNLGIQYRLFENTLTDNLRPYLSGGIGPNLFITTPYALEFFDSFGKAKLNWAVGGYAGFGANFGLSKTNLVGINFRYYYAYLLNKGVENLHTKFRKEIHSFYVTLNIGLMY